MRSAARNGGHERNRLARHQDGIETVEESNILVGDKYVHEPAQGSAIIEDAQGDTRIGHVHRRDSVTNRFGLHRYFADATDE